MSKVDLDRFTDFMCEYKKEIVKDYEEEIERLTAESTKWESKYYDEAKKIDKAIEHIDKELGCINVQENIMLKNELLKIKSMFKVTRKGEVVSLEELESYEPKNSFEEEYYDEMWS